MAVRVPAILDEVLERNPDYAPAIREAVSELRDALIADRQLSALRAGLPDADAWQAALAERAGHSWLGTDWFFAETYAYRQLIERVDFWSTARDPFISYKNEEYASAAHAAALDHALGLSGDTAERLNALFGAALWGNRIDLSFAAARVRGMVADSEDLLCDDREAAVRVALSGQGPVHVIADNAGTELTMDLALSDFVLNQLEARVALHVKVHPTFVSDATERDVRRFLETSPGAAAGACLGRLGAALSAGTLEILPHPFWNSPLSLWEMPEDLKALFGSARLVVLKGDANYRRALGDAIWPAETPFADAVSYFPAPLLALRTLKSDPIVGLSAGKADELDAHDPSWRVNGKRGVASLGGLGRP